jgi:putative PIN family toxin of toxin-antitoxin system
MKALIAGMAALVARATYIRPTKELSICRDPADNILLECSLAASANILITGDKDLLAISDLPFELRIVTPREFLKESQVPP